MKALSRRRQRQRGAALILFATVLILGVAWYAIGALGKAASATAERETRTGHALQAAKQALLGYAAQYAARTDFDVPGRLPCPETLGSIGTANEGSAASNCSNSSAEIGRLPWRTLGIEQPRDGHGETLWYVLGPGFRQAPINFATAGQLMLDGTMTLAYDAQTVSFTTGATVTGNTSGASARITADSDSGATGTLTLDSIVGAFVDNETITDTSGGAAVANGRLAGPVALIIAPGVAINSLNEPGAAPAGCSKVDQQASRYASPLTAAKFFECGNATGSYITVGSAPWSNDRAIAITAGELMNAISGAVADRLQRQVLPALWRWDADEQAARGKSWGTTHGLPYLPYAATFSDPTANSYCGTAGTGAARREGLPPIASTASAGCSSAWIIGTLSETRLDPFGCSLDAITQEVVCQGTRQPGAGPRATIRLTAQHVAEGFRGTIRASDIIVSHGGTPTIDSMSISSGSGTASTRIKVDWPNSVPYPAIVTVRIPNLSDAAVLSDPRLTWFLANEWHRYTYYAVSRGETVNNTNTCTSSGDTDCIQVRGLPTSTGIYWNKRLVLVLSGMPLSGQSRPSGNLSDYFEEQNQTSGDRIYRADLKVANPSALAPPHPAFNDRAAACPFQQTTDSGTAVICN